MAQVKQIYIDDTQKKVKTWADVWENDAVNTIWADGETRASSPSKHLVRDDLPWMTVIIPPNLRASGEPLHQGAWGFSAD